MIFEVRDRLQSPPLPSISSRSPCEQSSKNAVSWNFGADFEEKHREWFTDSKLRRFRLWILAVVTSIHPKNNSPQESVTFL